DGINHWNITSPFVTNTLPVDTAMSFNQGPIIDGKILNSSTTQSALWIAGTGQLMVVSGYFVTGSYSCGATLYFIQNDYYDNNNAINFTPGHYEPVTTDYLYCLDGTATSPVMRGNTYKGEMAWQVKTAMFRIVPTSSITSATLHDADIQIVNTAPNNTAPT